MTYTAQPTANDEPSIYVACLAAYNNGILHGEWVEISDEIDDTWKAIRNVLASSPIPQAEEWAIHDFQGFGGIRLSEYETIERVHELADFLLEHDKIGALALSHHDGAIDDAETTLENYMGCYTSLADYAEESTEGTATIPKHLEFYIDYERMGKDMESSGDVFTIQTNHDKVHVFLNH